jgi:hypothetical protein
LFSFHKISCYSDAFLSDGQIALWKSMEFCPRGIKQSDVMGYTLQAG